MRKMSKAEVLKVLGENVEVLENFGVKKIGIFGSAVRDEMREDSDIDLVVEFKEGRGGFRDFGGLAEFLEKLFGRDVDLVTPDGIESIRIKSVKERIRKELTYV